MVLGYSPGFCGTQGKWKWRGTMIGEPVVPFLLPHHLCISLENTLRGVVYNLKFTSWDQIWTIPTCKYLKCTVFELNYSQDSGVVKQVNSLLWQFIAVFWYQMQFAHIVVWQDVICFHIKTASTSSSTENSPDGTFFSMVLLLFPSHCASSMALKGTDYSTSVGPQHSWRDPPFSLDPTWLRGFAKLHSHHCQAQQGSQATQPPLDPAELMGCTITGGRPCETLRLCCHSLLLPGSVGILGCTPAAEPSKAPLSSQWMSWITPPM